MPFCTKCGAQVTGSFCSQCGTPAAAVGTDAAAPRRRGTHPLLIVVLVLVCLLVLGIVGVLGTGMWVARHGGGYALARMIAQANPNLEVVRTDDGARTLRLRDRRNGKEINIPFDDAQRGAIRFEANDDGKTAQVQIGGEAHVPGWVPVYPGAQVHPVVAASGESEEGWGEGGNFSLTTPDDAAKVAEFYQKQAAEMGMHLETNGRHGGGMHIVAKSDDRRQGFTAIMVPEAGGTTVNVTYGRKR